MVYFRGCRVLCYTVWAMAELIKTLKAALCEVESFGNSKAVDMLDRALDQAFRVIREKKKG